jgi:ABC-type lipoprotein export system ATPase subunit
LLADEPTGNLDNATSDLILRLLRRTVDERKTTLLMATHSVEAAAMADRIVRLRDGQVEDHDRAKEISCI